MDLALSLSDRLPGAGTLCIDGNPEVVISKDFEELTSPRSFTGSGSLYLKKGSMELCNEKLYERFLDKEVEISFWLYVDHRTDNMPTPELWQRDDEGKLLQKEKLNSREVHNVDGMWVRISKNLHPQPGIQYQLTIKGKFITIDDLLIKPAGTRILVRHDNGDRILDNYRIPVATDH
jgi:hypothetical protein